jgi:hypothetical protein
MTVNLTWEGPFGPGSIPDDPLLFERLGEAGVYLRVKLYDNDRLVAYAGQSVSLISRFDQHLTAMLSLTAPLRDRFGKIAYSGDVGARFSAYNDVSSASALAATDTQRVRFWYAMCDEYFHIEHLNLVEGLLQRRLAEQLSDVENAIAAPGKMPEDVPDRWENDFSGLGPADQERLTSLLGSAPMIIPTD